MRKLLFIISLCCTITAWGKTTSTIDSLVTTLEQTDSLRSPNQWIQLCLEIGEKYRKVPDYSIAIEYLKRAKRLAEEQALHHQLLDIDIEIADALHGFGQYQSSLQYTNQILNQLPKDSLNLRGMIYRIAGMNQVMLGEYSEAYASQMEARRIYNELGDSSVVARVEFGLGNNFFYQKQYDLSLKHFQNALEICEKINLQEGIYKAYNAIGSVFESQGNLPEALKYCNEALSLATDMEDKRGAAWALMNIGSILCQMERCQEGIRKLNECREIAVEMSDRPLESYALEALALSYARNQNYELAIQYLSKSEQLSMDGNDRSNLLSIYENFSSLYYEKSDFENYKIYNDKFLALKDSLHNEKMIEELSSLKTNFSLREMERENEILLIKKETEISRLQSLTGMVIGGGILAVACLLVFILYARNKSAREKNELLNQKNQEIIHQNELLRSSNQDLEKYAYIISHDLKEPLRNVSGFATLLKRKLKGEDNEATREYLEFIIKGAQQMHFLLHDLLQYSKIGVQENIMTEPISATQVVHEVISDMTHQLEEVQVKVTVGDLPVVHFHKTFLYQIFLNLLGNAIKFRSDKPLQIEIGSQQENGYHILSVKDNGIGIAPEFHEKIFIVFQRLHNREDYQGSGIGLATCRKIIQKTGGDIWVESEEQAGSTFYFSIPVAEEEVAVEPTSTIYLGDALTTLN